MTYTADRGMGADIKKLKLKKKGGKTTVRAGEPGAHKM